MRRPAQLGEEHHEEAVRPPHPSVSAHPLPSTALCLAATCCSNGCTLRPGRKVPAHPRRLLRCRERRRQRDRPLVGAQALTPPPLMTLTPRGGHRQVMPPCLSRVTAGAHGCCADPADGAHAACQFSRPAASLTGTPSYAPALHGSNQVDQGHRADAGGSEHASHEPTVHGCRLVPVPGQAKSPPPVEEGFAGL